MEKILAYADRTISRIGWFVLRKPLVSGLMIFLGIAGTVYYNGHLTFLNNNTVASLSFSPLSIPEEPIGNLAAFSSTSNTDDIRLSNQTKTEQVLVPSEMAPHNDSFESATKPSKMLPVANDPSQINMLDGNWQIVQVRAGDNLSKIFKRTHVSAQDLVFIAAMKDAKALKRLAVGEQIQVLVDDKRRLQRLVYFNEEKKSLVIAKTEQGLKTISVNSLIPSKVIAEKEPEAVPKPAATATAVEAGENFKKSTSAPTQNYVAGEIHKSLYTDARKLGLTAKQAQELVHIFSANIVNKLHPGDQFGVIYEPMRNDKSGPILAAKLTTQGKDYQMVRFTDPHGHTDYYTPNGETLHPGINRAPTHYSHISSKFSKKRFHPLLGFVRPHDGVDYAAPTGTPITAAGPGVVTMANYKGGYGKMVSIRHDNKYSTLYAHMSRFAANIKPGTHVKAGQVIGYIGRTGLASGSHLHFEIHVHNVAMDPLTVALPNASVPAAYRSRFLAQTRTLLAQLETKKTIHLAQNPIRIKPS